MTWAVVPAAGRGTRYGAQMPKQYVEVAGMPLIGHALQALLAHASVEGAVVVLAADDGAWPSLRSLRWRDAYEPPSRLPARPFVDRGRPWVAPRSRSAHRKSR